MPAIDGSVQHFSKSSNPTLNVSADISWKACPGEFEGESVGMIMRSAQENGGNCFLLNTKDSTHGI